MPRPRDRGEPPLEFCELRASDHPTAANRRRCGLGLRRSEVRPAEDDRFTVIASPRLPLRHLALNLFAHYHRRSLAPRSSAGWHSPIPHVVLKESGEIIVPSPEPIDVALHPLVKADLGTEAKRLASDLRVGLKRANIARPRLDVVWPKVRSSAKSRDGLGYLIDRHGPAIGDVHSASNKR